MSFIFNFISRSFCSKHFLLVDIFAFTSQLLLINNNKQVKIKNKDHNLGGTPQIVLLLPSNSKLFCIYVRFSEVYIIVFYLISQRIFHISTDATKNGLIASDNVLIWYKYLEHHLLHFSMSVYFYLFSIYICLCLFHSKYFFWLL